MAVRARPVACPTKYWEIKSNVSDNMKSLASRLTTILHLPLNIACVDLGSAAHGFLVWSFWQSTTKVSMMNDECVKKQFFSGLSKRKPASLADVDVPHMACDDCIFSSTSRDKVQIVCPHIPKFRFFERVTSGFKLTFKRPGSDQCEKCNSLHNKILLLRAMGRHDEADNVEDNLDEHQQELTEHHRKAAEFRALMNDERSATHVKIRSWIHADQVPLRSWHPMGEFRHLAIDIDGCRVGAAESILSSWFRLF